jgi:hypothetical protein
MFSEKRTHTHKESEAKNEVQTNFAAFSKENENEEKEA